MNDVSAEIAIFAVTQIGVTIWLLSAMRRDITNLTGWVADLRRLNSAFKSFPEFLSFFGRRLGLRGKF